MSKLASASIVIAFAYGGIIPATVLGREKDVTVPPHEPIKVPEFYGKQLIRDRIAYDPAEKAEEEKQAAALRSARIQPPAADAELISRLSGLEEEVLKLNDELVAERQKSAELEAKLQAATAPNAGSSTEKSLLDTEAK